MQPRRLLERPLRVFHVMNIGESMRGAPRGRRLGMEESEVRLDVSEDLGWAEEDRETADELSLAGVDVP